MYVDIHGIFMFIKYTTQSIGDFFVCLKILLCRDGMESKKRLITGHISAMTRLFYEIERKKGFRGGRNNQMIKTVKNRRL